MAMRRGGLAALLVFAGASGCRTPGSMGSQLNDTEVRNFEDELGMKPGVGFDGVLEDVRGTCTDNDGLDPGGNSQEAIYSIKLVESHKELLGQLGISSASQVKAAIPDDNLEASRKTKFAMGNTFSINRYSVFLLVSARIRNETTNLKNLRIKDSVKAQLAANPEQGLNQFRAQCGDSFMSAFSTGGEYQAVIEIRTDTDEATTNLKNGYSSRFSAGAATGGTSSEIEAGITAMTSNRDVRIWTYQRGGAGESEVGLVANVQDMMARLKRLADSARQGQNPRPLTATFADYFTLALPLPDSYRDRLNAAKDVIENLASAQTALLDLQANLDYVVTQPAAFVGVDAAKLKQIRDVKRQIEDSMKKIRDRGRACAANYATCLMVENVAPPAIDVPRRKPTIESLAQQSVKIKTKLHFFNVNDLYDGWFNPPECYLEIRAGGNGDTNFIPIRRTETDYGEPRCSKLGTEITIPIAIIKDAYANLGVPLDKGWIEVVAWEDDPVYDDLIGSTWVYFKSLTDGAQLKGMNTKFINMDVGFEIEY